MCYIWHFQYRNTFSVSWRNLLFNLLTLALLTANGRSSSVSPGPPPPLPPPPPLVMMAANNSSNSLYKNTSGVNALYANRCDNTWKESIKLSSSAAT